MMHNSIALSARLLCSYLFVAILLANVIAVLFTPTFAAAQASVYDQLSCTDVRGQDQLDVRMVGQEGATVAPAESLSRSVSITNDHNYTLQDLSVGVAVYRSGQLVPYDWFEVASDLDLSSGEQRELMVDWTVPSNAPTGEYELSIFVMQSDNDQLLANTLNRVGEPRSVTFSVVGESAPTVYFSDALVNGAETEIGAVGTFETATGSVVVDVLIQNDMVANPVGGPLTLVVYEGFYPHSYNEVAREEYEYGIMSESNETATIEFSAAYDQYIVAGQFETDEGIRSSFVLPLERAGTEFVHSEPMPEVSHLGVQSTEDGLYVVGCLGNRESSFIPDGAQTSLYDVEYRLSVHPLDGNGEPLRSDLLTSANGSGVLGGVVNELGIRQAMTSPVEQFLIRLEALKNGSVVDVTEARYSCDPVLGCALSPESATGSTEQTIFGMGVGAFIMAMQLVTLFLLLVVMSIFVCNTYPLMMEAMRRRREHEDLPYHNNENL